MIKERRLCNLRIIVFIQKIGILNTLLCNQKEINAESVSHYEKRGS